VTREHELGQAAELFKVLGNGSRLRLLRLLREGPKTVGALAAATRMSQPLVSQHLRTLRQSDLVTATRNGREVTYAVADQHVAQVIGQALAHVQEPVTAEDAADDDLSGEETG
jgi:DNA-binding transcriptional ArsR family regulator